MSKIISAKVFLAPTNGTGTFAKLLLGDPGPNRAYKILSFAATLFDGGVSATDGVIVGLQDGEIEPGLLAAGGAGSFAEFVNTDAILLDELYVYHTAGLPAFGTGNSGFSSDHMHWQRFVTANEQHLLVKVQDAGTKKLYAHLEYEQINISERDWLALKHRSPVVDQILNIST